MEAGFIRGCRNTLAAARLSLLVLFAMSFGVAGTATFAAEPLIDSIVVKLRDGAVDNPMGGLTNDEQEALFDEAQTPFSHVGYTRDGALELRLLNPLPLRVVRAAVNRVRMMPQVLYANVVPPATAGATDAANVPGTPSAQPKVRTMIVKFRDAATSEAARRGDVLPRPQIDRLSARAGQPLGHERAMSGDAFVVRLFQALPLAQARSLAAILAADPEVEYAEPDILMHPLLVPNDPRYAEQWHYLSPQSVMGGANLPPAWDLTTGSLGIVVAVLDTGYLPSHPDLAGRFIGGYDFISDCARANDDQPGPCTWTGSDPNQTPNTTSRDSDASDPGDWVASAENAGSTTAPPYHWFQGCGTNNSTFHGTHVAGTIGAATDNGTGVAGINWVSKILPVRVLGKCGGTTADIIDAIRWSVGMSIDNVPDNPDPARVLNMSFGGSSPSCGAIQGAINDALARNAVVVVAAGNSNADASQSTPANCNGVITVGATGFAGQRAPYSNYGPMVEISAPGGASNDGSQNGHYVLSTINNSTTSPDLGIYTYASYQGTSMATPHVSGIASLMLSRNPALTPSQVLATIQTTARAFPTGTLSNCTTALCGAGIIDAGAAVLAVSGLTATTTTLTSSGSPALVGSSVAFTATVTGSSPTGNVTFTEGGNAIAGCPVGVTLSGTPRTASCSTSGLAAGSHSIVASYGGDPGNAASASAALTQVITGLPTAATFVGTDVATQGNWHGLYGSDGYAVLGDSTSYPAYAQVTQFGQASYTWAAQPNTDPRALQRAASGRIAACWYAAGSFTVDVNLTDQGSHRVALYLLDWDTTTRATRVDVLDAATQQVLATQTVQSFSAGVYLVWNVQGHVLFRFTNVGGPNTVLSGIFFDPTVATTTYAVSGSVTAGGNALAGVNFSATAASCTASNAQGQYSCTVPQNWSGTVTPALAGYNFTPASRNYSGVAANQTAQDYTASAVAATTTTLTSSGSPALVGSSVAFTATVTGSNPTGNVTFTEGGNAIAGCPVGVTLSGTPRTASCSTSGLAAGSHSIVASYGGDPGNAASASAALTQVITGLPTAATFVGTDVATQGNWHGLYGSDGYAVLGDSTSYPAYAQVTQFGQASYTWAAQPNTDPRALQRAASGRIAACWYAAGSFTVDVNLTDQGSHRVALYLLDWDTTTRATRVDVLDAATQQVLATQTVQSFSAGVYLVWNVQGHVLFRFTNVGGPNTVLSGIFFDPTVATTTYAVSGSVTAGGNALAGVNFSATAASCTASNAQGQYSCTVPQNWSGTVTPALAGYNFTPASRNYSGVAANQTAQDYTASAVAATTTTLTSSGSPALVGSSVAFTATVTGSNPTGNVTFTEGGNAIAGCPVGVTLSGTPRTASCSTSGLAAGSHSIVASYGGDPGNAASASAALTQVITGLPTAATFVGTDVATQGNWHGLYGSDGYAVLGDSTSYPAYAQVTQFGQASYTWAAQPNTDPRALQRAASGRIAACWYAAGSFTVDVNLTDQGSHRVALYLLDWDTTTRATRVDVLDAATQQVLATQTVQSFSAGVYLVWNVQGHVLFRFTNVGGANAVLSGIFFN